MWSIKWMEIWLTHQAHGNVINNAKSSWQILASLSKVTGNAKFGGVVYIGQGLGGASAGWKDGSTRTL